MDPHSGPSLGSGLHPPLHSPAQQQQRQQIPPFRELEHGPPPLPPSLHAPNLTTYIHHVHHYTFHGNCTIYQASDVPQVYTEPGSYDQSHTARQHDTRQHFYGNRVDPWNQQPLNADDPGPSGAVARMRPLNTSDASQRLAELPPPGTATMVGQDHRDIAMAIAPQVLPNRPEHFTNNAEASSGIGSVREPPPKRRAHSDMILSRQEGLQPSQDLPRLAALRLQSSIPVERYISTSNELGSRGSQEFRTSNSNTPGGEITRQTSTAVFGVSPSTEHPLSDATQPIFRRGTSTGSVGIGEGLQHRNENMNFMAESDHLNDWEYVVAMYMTGKGTPDGRPLKSIGKGDGHKVEDRKLLEKRRTIGKTYEKLGKERFERAVGYSYETGEKRKRKMYHVIARCRIVNAIRRANAELPEDPVELDNLISHHVNLKMESRGDNAAIVRERASDTAGFPPSACDESGEHRQT